MASVSANDVWSVGDAENSLGNSEPLILHWDGTVWTIVPSPTTGIIVGLFTPALGSGQQTLTEFNS